MARMVVRSFMEKPEDIFQHGASFPPRDGILALVAEGLSNKEIGARLHISFATVRTHLNHNLRKAPCALPDGSGAKYLRSNPSCFEEFPRRPDDIDP